MGRGPDKQKRKTKGKSESYEQGYNRIVTHLKTMLDGATTEDRNYHRKNAQMQLDMLNSTHGKPKGHEPSMKKSIGDIMDEINKEIEEMAETMEKSVQTPDEKLIETIQNLGPEGLKKALPNLSDDEKVLLKDVMETMAKAKSPSMDDNYHVGYHKGDVYKDTVIQEDKADDDADEKLVDPKKAKMKHQGDNNPEGFEGQVIKSEDCKKDAKKEVEKHEDKMHKDKKKMEKCDMKKSELLEYKTKAEEVLKSEGVEITNDLIKSKMKELIKADSLIESRKAGETNIEGTVEKGKLLKEEDQLSDTDMATEGKSRAKKENCENLKEGEDNKAAQDKVNDVNQGGLKKSINFAGENDLLKANTGGRNFHFSMNDYVENMEKSENSEGETLEKSEKKQEEYDLNDLIENNMTKSWGEIRTEERIEKSIKDQNGRLTKSFQDNEIAQALGLTEEEAKQILGE